MTLEQLKWITIILAFIVYWIFIRNILKILLQIELSKTKAKRGTQLTSFENRVDIKTNEEQIKDLIEHVTQPVIYHVMPKLRKRDYNKLEKDLKLIGWDKYYTPEQFAALSIFLKILGTIIFLLLAGPLFEVAILWFGALFFVLDIGFKGTVDDKYDKLLCEFPDFIEVVDGYLSAGYSLVDAIKQVEPLTNEWQPILREFLIICKYSTPGDGLDYIRDTVDIFEVREFIAILQLGMEQGIDMAENFKHQSSAIDQLKDVAFEKKLAKRQVQSILIQGPLLLTVLATFSLPTIHAMLNMQSM